MARRGGWMYYAAFRARQEQAKFDRLIRFAQRLPDLRAAMARYMDNRSARPASACPRSQLG
jgi:DNA topoisomerase IB